MSVQELIQAAVTEELLGTPKHVQPIQTRTAPQRRIMIRFSDPYDIPDGEFQVSDDYTPLEYHVPTQRIPLATKSNKGAQEEMMYYVQYVLHQFKIASNLFSTFHYNGDVITVVFDCPNGFSIAYDFKLYCAGDWMLQDCNISQSYHFATWGDIDFAILNMLQHARHMVEKVFHQPMSPSNWEDGKPILVFVSPPKRTTHSDSESSDDYSSRSNKKKQGKAPARRRKETESDDVESDSYSETDSSSSESPEDNRRKKSSKGLKRR